MLFQKIDVNYRNYPKEMKASAIPRAFDRSDSSVYLSAIIESPAVSAKADPTP